MICMTIKKKKYTGGIERSSTNEVNVQYYSAFPRERALARARPIHQGIPREKPRDKPNRRREQINIHHEFIFLN